MAKRLTVHGSYNAERYEVWSGDVLIYEAGNSPFDSQVYVDAEDGVGLDQMRAFCESTTRDMAKERNEDYGGIEPLED